MLKFQIGCLAVMLWALVTLAVSAAGINGKRKYNGRMLTFIFGVLGIITESVAIIFSEQGGPIEWYERLMYYGLYFLLIAFFVRVFVHAVTVTGRKVSYLYYIPAAIGVLLVIWLPIELTTVYTVNYAYGGAVYAALCTCAVYGVLTVAVLLAGGGTVGRAHKISLICAEAGALAVLALHIYGNELSALSLTVVLLALSMITDGNDAYDIREMLQIIAADKKFEYTVDEQVPVLLKGDSDKLRKTVSGAYEWLTKEMDSSDVTLSVKVSRTRDFQVRLYFCFREEGSENEVFFSTWQRLG